MSTRVKDSGRSNVEALIAKLDEMAANKITVGVHADDGAASHTRAKVGRRRKARARVSVVDVAAWAEFGTPREPARSWLRATIDAKAEQINARIRQVARALLKGEIASVEQAMAMIGSSVVRMIRRQFSQLPAKTPATIDRGTRSSTPLIDTRQFAGAIGARVNGKRIEARDEGGENG